MMLPHAHLRVAERTESWLSRDPPPSERGGSVRHNWPASDADRGVAAIYGEHYRPLARIAALLLGDGAAAEELVQDAFVSVHRAWRHLRDEEEALDYLRRTMIKTARVQNGASPELLNGQRDRTAAFPAPDIPRSLLIAGLRGLPARQREALVLKYFADWPDAQIAAAMGISRHALNAHLQRGLAALQAVASPDSAGRD